MAERGRGSARGHRIEGDRPQHRRPARRGPDRRDIGLQTERFLVYVTLFSDQRLARQAELGLRAKPEVRGAIANGATAVQAADRIVFVANGRGTVVDDLRLDEVVRVVGRIAVPPPLQPGLAAARPGAPPPDPDVLEQLGKLGVLLHAQYAGLAHDLRATTPVEVITSQLGPTDLEDLVAVYLQDQHHMVLINRGKSTVGYEYVLRDRDTGRRAVATVKSGGYAADLDALPTDPDVDVWAYTVVERNWTGRDRERWHAVDQHVLPAEQHMSFCFYAVGCSADGDRVSTLQRELSALHAPGHRSPDEDLGCARHDWRSAHFCRRWLTSSEPRRRPGRCTTRI